MQTATAPMTNDRTSPDADKVLRMTRRFEAPRERVFQAFADPNELVRWWGPEGYDVPEIRLDPRPGGTWRTCMRSPEGELHCVGGVYREVAPPERLVFTWAWENDSMSGVETLVTLTFHDRDGATELELVHEGFPRSEARDKHGEGWTGCLDCLAKHLAA